MNVAKLLAAAKRMGAISYTNCKGDGICPWCKIKGCWSKCDLGIIRAELGLPAPTGNAISFPVPRSGKTAKARQLEGELPGTVVEVEP